MEKSTSIQNLAKALILFHVKVDKVNKDATNPFFKSKYASLSNILETINIPLNECSLAFVQFPTGEHGLITILIHAESGEYIQECYEMKPVKDDPQSRGSAITYQRRYALAAILGLNIDDDDDANAASKPEEIKKTTAGKDGELPWLDKGTPQYAAVIKRLQEKTTDIQTVKKYYKLNKLIEANLIAALNTDALIEEAPF